MHSKKGALLLLAVLLLSLFAGCTQEDMADPPPDDGAPIAGVPAPEGTVPPSPDGGVARDAVPAPPEPAGGDQDDGNINVPAGETPGSDNTETAPATTPAPPPSQDSAGVQAQVPRPDSQPPDAPTPRGGAAAQPVAAQKPAGDVNGIELILNIPNRWNDGKNDFIQLDVTVKNNGDKTLDGWTVSVPVGKNAKIDQQWSGEMSLSNGVLTVTPVSYNKVVNPGQEFLFGLILRSPGGIGQGTLTAGSLTARADGGNGGGPVGDNDPPVAQAKDVPALTTDDWLFVKGNQIVDKNGKAVWLTGVNWFGYNTGTNTFDGLWACDLNAAIAQIADRGFNLLRVPFSAELIREWSNGRYPSANFNQATNAYLVKMNSLEIFDYVIGQCRANGLKMMIDIHSAKTDAMGHMKPMWYDGGVTEKDYLDALKWMAMRYAKDDTVIAYDLKNEPHGKPNESPRAKWDGSQDADNWKYVAEKAANAVFEGNPDVLVMVEGIEIYPRDTVKNGGFTSKNDGDYHYNWWGGNLRGVRDHPVDLGKYQNKLVYSPHDYGPTVYEQPWFKGGYTFDSLYKDCWYDNWFFIHKEGIAPLLIGEWGGFMREPNLLWMTYLRKLIQDNKLHHTFWCFNANSGDTGGLVLDDFKTWDEKKYEFVKEVLWTQNGQFVGLDHQIPLGKNGVSLSDAK